MNKFLSLLNKKLPAGSFARNVVTLMTGTTFSQLILILVTPILTRLYTPEDFGVYTLYISIVSILAVISCLRYELAIVLPEEDSDAANILGISVLICAGISLIVLVLVIFLRNQVSIILRATELVYWLWFLPLSLLVIGLFQSLNYWSTRRKQFKRLAIRQITQNSLIGITQISVGICNYMGPGGLIGGHIIGQASATGRLACQVWRDEGKQILSYLNKDSIKKMIVKYKQFPIYTSWSSLLNSGSAMMPPLLLGYFFTPSVVGFYALGHRILRMPLSVIGSAVAQVFFPRATEAKRKGELNQITLEVFKQLLTLSIVPISLIAIIAPDLFSLIFGRQWYTAGEYVRWLSLWSLFQFISSPISTVYFVLEKQKELLFFNIALISMNLIFIFIGGMQDNSLLTIKLLGLSGLIMYVYFSYKIMIMSGNNFVKTSIVLLNCIAQAIPYIAPLLIYIFLIGDSLISVIIAITTGIVFLGVKAKSFHFLRG